LPFTITTRLAEPTGPESTETATVVGAVTPWAHPHARQIDRAATRHHLQIGLFRHRVIEGSGHRLIEFAGNWLIQLGHFKALDSTIDSSDCSAKVTGGPNRPVRMNGNRLAPMEVRSYSAHAPR
jgi:hypothetical protein